MHKYKSKFLTLVIVIKSMPKNTALTPSIRNSCLKIRGKTDEPCHEKTCFLHIFALCSGPVPLFFANAKSLVSHEMACIKKSYTSDLLVGLE